MSRVDDKRAALETGDTATPREVSGEEPTTPALDGPRTHPLRLDVLAPGTRVGNRYVVRRLLGAGGMGAVYLAHDAALEKEVALKFLRPELADGAGIARLREEVRLAQQVTHPNVCRTYDLEELDGAPVIKMEYVDGEVLSARLGREGRLPVDEALRIARDVAAGLAAAHGQGVIHRDLKPHNILLESATGRVALMDFGLARRQQPSTTGAPSGIEGTPAYMAPEQARGETVDGRADLYALGCVLYQMLVGKLPYEASSPYQLIARHAGDPVPDPRARRPEIPSWLARVVMRLLAKRPDERYASARVLADALVPPRPLWRRALPSLLVLPLAGALAWNLFAPRRPVAATPWRAAVALHPPVYEENADSPALSPDGKWLAYVSDRDGHFRVWVEPFVGGLPSRAVTPPDLGSVGVRWARDGASLLVEGEGSVVWRVPMADGVGGALVRVARVARIPDECGGALAVFREDEVGSGGAILLLRDGVAPREVARVPVGETALDLRCSPDGRELAYSTKTDLTSRHGHASLVRAAVDGGAPHVLLAAEGQIRSVAWAADGQTLFYDRDTGEGFHLWEIARDGASSLQLTFDHGDQVSPAPLPDGRSVLFDDDATSRPLDAVPVDGRAPRRITHTLEDVEQAAVSADGRVLVAVLTLDGKYRAAAFSLDDGSDRALGAATTATLALDGKSAYLGVIASGRTRLTEVPLAGGAARLVADVPGEVHALHYGGDGRLHAWIEGRPDAGAWAIAIDDGVATLEAPSPVRWVLPAPRGGWRVTVTPDPLGRNVYRVLPPEVPVDGTPAFTAVSVNAVAWSFDGRMLYHQEDAEVRVYDTAARRDTVVGHIGDFDQLLAASPDGQVVYASTVAGHVRRAVITNLVERPRPTPVSAK